MSEKFKKIIAREFLFLCVLIAFIILSVFFRYAYKGYLNAKSYLKDEKAKDITTEIDSLKIKYNAKEKVVK